jgi:hypothetical protein
MEMTFVEEIGMWVAFVLTLMVYSYLLGDNPLYRLAEHLFIGSAVAYALVISYHSIIKPRLISPLADDLTENWPLLIPLALGLLLLTKIKASLAWLGNVSIAFLFGVGSAVAIGGALFGSLLPQVKATVVSLNPAHYPERAWEHIIDGLIVVLGTISVLLYFLFHIGGFKRGFVKTFAWLGRLIIMIAFGAIFANTVMSRITLLIGRFRFLLEVIGWS